ncbi:MAG: CoA transferase [Syntrophomonadaceae bacterium]|jgi:glutaconate CoA-transferase subunit A|nr:acyl CoA--acetate/3-ketoacid CoA transferase subunit alpha [Syntrophomonadaceae bacterium]MDH7496867.1 CoA transferase [Syntrophomonadaceae bacterium]
MGKPQRITIKEAANLIKDGDMLTFSGFTIWRRPMALVYELVRQQKKNLHLFEVNGGTHTEVLVGGGCVAIWESCWVGHELYGKLGEMVAGKQVRSEMIVEDYSHAQCVARLLAGAYGLPFLPTAHSMGTDILNPKYDMLGRAGKRDGSNPKIPMKKYDMMHDPFYDMGEILLMPAANPDWALIYAQAVGTEGTVRVHAQTYTDYEAIKAADKVIVLAEEIVPEDYLREEPALNLATGYSVDYIVELPWAAHPTGSQRFYDVDADFIRSFYAASKSQDSFNKWADEWIFGVADHQAYLEKLGITRLEKLRANSVLGYSTRVKRGSR